MLFINLFNPHPRTFFMAFRELGRERETLMWERNIDWLPSVCTLTRAQNPSLGMCSDWDSNLQHFSVHDNAPTEPHWPGLYKCFYKARIISLIERFWSKPTSLWNAVLVQLSFIEIPWYSFQLIRSRTHDKCWNWWVLNKRWAMKHLLLEGGIVTHTSSSKCDESWASAECWTLFSSKCDKYRVWQVLKPPSTKVWLYLKTKPRRPEWSKTWLCLSTCEKE